MDAVGNDDYRFGIIKEKRRMAGDRYLINNIGICACGQHIIGKSRWEKDFQCDNCGNDYFIDAVNQGNERFVIPYLKVLRKDNRGFKVKRINISIVYDNINGITVVKENLARTIDYDIVDKRLKVWRNDELEFDYDSNNVGRIDSINKLLLRQIDIDTFLNVVSNEVTRGLYDAGKKLGHLGWNRKDNLLYGLVKLMEDYQWMQILANAGIPQVDRFYISASRRKDTAIDGFKTKPHQILRVPKFMIQHIREDVTIDRYVLQQLQGNFSRIDNNKLREIMSIVRDESTMRELSNAIDTVMQIHIDYDYTNIKKLILYLFREVRLTQGIASPRNASTYLRDYIRMSRSMGLEWDKYPKSLKKEHDVVQMNYNLLNNKNSKQKEFKLAIDKASYQNLAFKDKKSKYTVITPIEVDDLVREGNQLSHCVASYVDDVASDRCKILFLREVDNIDTPLATIEIRGFNIRQARGYANRALDEEQREFVRKWAEEKNLIEAYY